MTRTRAYQFPPRVDRTFYTRRSLKNASVSLSEPFRLRLKSIFLHLLVCFSAHRGFRSTPQAMLRWSQVPVFFVPNWLRFKWMITTKCVVLVYFRKTQWFPNECTRGLRVRQLSLRQLLVHAGWSYFAVFICPCLNPASSQAISCSSALMSFKRLICSQIKKTLIQIISFIWKIDKRQLNSYS